MADGGEHETFGQELTHDASLRRSKTSADANLLLPFAGLEPESANGAQTEVDHKEDGERDLAAKIARVTTMTKILLHQMIKRLHLAHIRLAASEFLLHRRA